MVMEGIALWRSVCGRVGFLSFTLPFVIPSPLVIPQRSGGICLSARVLNDLQVGLWGGIVRASAKAFTSEAQAETVRLARTHADPSASLRDDK